MKKLLAIALCAALAATLAGCSMFKQQAPISPNDTQSNQTEQTTTPEDTQKPSKNQAQGNGLTEEPVKTEQSEQEDYLTKQVDALKDYCTNNIKFHMLGTVEGQGVTRYIMLFRQADNPDMMKEYMDLTASLGVTTETFKLCDASQTPIESQDSYLTDYGTIFFYDVPTENAEAFKNNNKLLCTFGTENTMVDFKLQPFTITVDTQTIVDPTSLTPLNQNTIGIYKLSDSLWCMPTAHIGVITDRETSVEDKGTVRYNYSQNNSFIVWGSDTVPMNASVTNPSIAAHPHYTILDTVVSRSEIIPYMYNVSFGYNEGTISVAQDADPSYLAAREKIEGQFVLNWGNAKIANIMNPEVVDINQFIS